MIPLIPMMGLGERFSKNGYSEYKPLVRINSEHLIKKIVSKILKHFSEVYIVCNEDVSEQIRSIFSEEVKIITLKENTRGASETVLRSCDFLPKNQQIACIDCDTILHDEAIIKLKQIKSNGILTFKDPDKIGIYSYLLVDNNNIIKGIEEKIAISDIANAGIYVFRDSDLLKLSCENLLKSEGELYLSQAIQQAINFGEIFESIDITNQFDCCGTPYQLREYSKNTSLNDKKTICFDIDGTLVYDLYKNPKAIEKNVKFCNECYKSGHEIILHTARGMLSTNKNAERIEGLRPYIEKVLADLGILYSELILMKPYADLYIDDKAIPAHRNLEKESGLYVSEDHSPRTHHKIIVDGDHIVKEGDLRSEANYYDKIPIKLKHLFPEIQSVSSIRIKMEKFKHSTYSSLLLSKKLSKHDIDILISSLKKIHQLENTTSDLDLSWAYKNKLYERYSSHKSLYTNLGVNIEDFIEYLDKIKTYSFGIIHGDPVFTNVFIDREYCKFIDPRGEWQNEMTIYGDTEYDYAKVLQSLYGYDYILHSEQIDFLYLKSLRDHFIDKLLELDKEINLEQLKSKTISLYLSLVPFHKDNLDKCRKYINIIKSIT